MRASAKADARDMRLTVYMTRHVLMLAKLGAYLSFGYVIQAPIKHKYSKAAVSRHLTDGFDFDRPPPTE